ncbi:MAG: ATP-binding protein [Chloroflexi bacterium]|nr:ATP-binding protein [Chloroflexota bacterium]
MATVYLLIGLQGSGKSVWANENAGWLEAEVISSDEIRNELEAQGKDAMNNGRVFAIFNERLERELQRGRNVILDATHARRTWRADSLAIARQHGSAAVGVWFDVPLVVCRQRNASRKGELWGERAVPDNFLLGVARGFEGPEAGEFDEVWRIMNGQAP